MRPMITNGGPHPADKWADMTTDTVLDLVQISEDSVSQQAQEARQAKRDMRSKLFDVFNRHHDRLQKHEQGELAKEYRKRIASGLDPSQHLPSTMAEVNAVFDVSPFKLHFSQPAVQRVVRTIIGQHSADVMHIERQWHGKPRGMKEAV